MKKILLTMLVFVSATLGMQAQPQDRTDGEYRLVTAERTEFNRHWFLQLQGGAQYTLGEAKFDKLISPNVQLGIGYQFSPVIGVRLQANAWQSKGGWPGYEQARDPQYTPYIKDYKYKYVAPGIDVMFNLSNLICGWNPKRFFNVTAFLGGGANIAFDNDEANEIGSHLKSLDDYELQYLWDGTKVRPFGRAGLDLDFRVSDAVSIVVEGNANIIDDHYNSKKAGNPDWYFNALLGLKINLGKTYKHYDAVYEFIPFPPKPQPKPEPKPEPKPAPKAKPLTVNVFFTINRTEIRDSEIPALTELLDYMNQYPKSVVEITGYADKDTGTTIINDRLSVGRAAAVKAYLMDRGIAEDRIIADAKGDTVQPYETPEENRVTVCFAEEK